MLRITIWSNKSTVDIIEVVLKKNETEYFLVEVKKKSAYEENFISNQWTTASC